MEETASAKITKMALDSQKMNMRGEEALLQDTKEAPLNCSLQESSYLKFYMK